MTLARIWRASHSLGVTCFAAGGSSVQFAGRSSIGIASPKIRRFRASIFSSDSQYPLYICLLLPAGKTKCPLVNHPQVGLFGGYNNASQCTS
jgi:hypothetical protein